MGNYNHAITRKTFGVLKKQIPEKPATFEVALERVFESDFIIVELKMKNLIVETFHLREDRIVTRSLN